MAISLSLAKGSRVLIGDSRLEVCRVMTSSNFTVRYKGELYRVTDGDWTDLEEGVKVRACFPRKKASPWSKKVRIQVEAPLFFVLRV